MELNFKPDVKVNLSKEASKKLVELLSGGRTFQVDATVGAKVLGHSIHRMFGHKAEAGRQHRSERKRVTGDKFRDQKERRPG